MPQSIPKGLTRECVLRALADLDAGIEHPFGPAMGYELIHDGRRYAPKAVIGLACRSLLGRVLLPDEFSGGEAPGQANYVLRGLGFTVARKGEISRSEEDQEAVERRQPWTPHEVELIVVDYFEMLRAELAGEPYSKAEHSRELRPNLNDRSKQSIEDKHRKISAVLIELGQPYIDGYKPAPNIQKTLLPQAVRGYLIRNPEFFGLLADGPVLSPRRGATVDDRRIEGYFESPPERIIVPVRTISRGYRGGAGRSTPRAGTPSIAIRANRVSSSRLRSRDKGWGRPNGTTWPRRSNGCPRPAATAWGSTCCRSTPATTPSGSSRSRRPGWASTSRST
jgi:hypothetical protein